LQIVATRKADQNRAVIDPWTAVHFSTGLALGLMDISLEKSIAAALGYELAEQFVERQGWGRELFNTSGPESLANAAMDLAVFSLGHLAGELWNRTGKRARR
jgi:hypothetical protein